MTFRKKLIEVALPLEAINAESAREKSIRHGHPSTLHLWWARRPLAACRAVLLAQLVDDPDQPGLSPALLELLDQLPAPAEERLDWDTLSLGEQRRYRLFALIEKLVKWENINDEKLLEQARTLIRASAGPDGPPPLLDPFAGGGSIPLEAQRLGLEAHASDLNPVAVLINKALIEIPPKFAGQPPVHPQGSGGAEGQGRMFEADEWRGAKGLAEDVRYYGRWMRDEAEKRIGHLYPKVKLPPEYGGGEATVIAWLWARTVKCPNPTCGIQMPLVSSFILSSKQGKERYLDPQVINQKVIFYVSTKPPKDYKEPQLGLKRGTSGIFECAACRTVTTRDYVANEAMAGRLGTLQMAIVAEGIHGRVYVPANLDTLPQNIPVVDTTGLDTEFPPNPRDLWCRNFGLDTPAKLFTPRQLATLTVFSDLVAEAHSQVQHDALAVGLTTEVAISYANAVATYLSLAISKLTDYNSTCVVWSPSRDQAKGTFARQALPMVWDFGEVNPFARAAGDLAVTLEGISRTIENNLPTIGDAKVSQIDAISSELNFAVCISTDPPYYDNISYADLSDFFYVWLRRSLSKIFPNLFGTLMVPKSQELVASSYRFEGSQEAARHFFEDGLEKAFHKMREKAHQDYPLTVYYAFKQAEEEISGVASTGWETMLEGLVRAKFVITGTWPIRTERSARSVSIGTNALASSIVLVCRPRPDDAPITTRRDFLRLLKQELPAALRDLQRGNIAPVDLAQASIGPGMAIFSRHKAVFEADGSPMRVRTALALINQALDEYLAEQEGEYDADTRWALAWYEQFAFNEGPFGDAETLSKAKNTSVGGMVEAGILAARGGKARLLRRDEQRPDWDPAGDARLTVWEVVQQLIHSLDQHGERGAADLLSRVPPGPAEAARDLAYRLYTLCERKGWAGEALPYNSLVVAWPEVVRLAGEIRRSRPVQGMLL